MKTLVVNLYGGPGAGKSTLAALVYAELKMLGVNVELVREYAKELAWEGTLLTTPQQVISDEQWRRQQLLLGRVDVIVTDAPLMQGAYYATPQEREAITTLCQQRSAAFSYLDFWLERPPAYSEWGRVQTEEEALRIDDALYIFLLQHSIDPHPTHSSEWHGQQMANVIWSQINNPALTTA